MKFINATVVAVMMPFSAVVTGTLSVIVGMDELTTNLVIGAILGLTAMLVCAFGDRLSEKHPSTTD